MLYLMGIGLTKGDLPTGTIETCKKCEFIYADRYTTYVTEDRIEQVEYLTGKGVKRLNREMLEERLSAILDEAKEKNVAVLVGGDPLIATTHKIIFIAAKKAGVPVKVHHATSAIAVMLGESGLDFYRFGQTCTIARWSKHYEPISFYETIQRNIRNNLHSLVLLDWDISNNSSMQLPEALKILNKAEDSYRGKIIGDDTMIIVIHKITYEDEKKLFIPVKEALDVILDPGPTTLIIPAQLSDIEKEIIGAIY
jgi:diphthine synthase